MSKKTTVNLTVTRINALKEGEEIWDSEVRGLHVRAGAKGKAFLFAYVSPITGTRRRKGWGVISLDQARDLAADCKTLIRQGLDPLDEEEKKKEAAKEQAGKLQATLGNLEARWEAEAKKSETYWHSRKNAHGDIDSTGHERATRAFVNMKPQTIRDYRKCWLQINRHFKADKTLASFTAVDIQNFHDGLSVKKPREKKGPMLGGRRQANKVINFMASIFRASIVWNIMDERDAGHFDGMFRKIDMHPTKKKTTFLAEEHFPKFDAQLIKMRAGAMAFREGSRPQLEMLEGADLIELIKLQGNRIGEIMRGRLSWINWSGRVKVLHLLDSKNGAKAVELGEEACIILKRKCEEWHRKGGVPGDENDWIIRSFRSRGQPLRNPYNGWKTFLKDAGLPPDLMPHALRHTMATVTIHKTGASMAQAGNVLSHKSTKTTEGYVQNMRGSAVDVINRTNEVMRQMGQAKPETDSADDIVPDYVRAERQSQTESERPMVVH